MLFNVALVIGILSLTTFYIGRLFTRDWIKNKIGCICVPCFIFMCILYFVFLLRKKIRLVHFKKKFACLILFLAYRSFWRFLYSITQYVFRRKLATSNTSFYCHSKLFDWIEKNWVVDLMLLALRYPVPFRVNVQGLISIHTVWHTFG
jgi:hypothetical protein